MAENNKTGTSTSSLDIVPLTDYEDGYFAVVPLSHCPHLQQVRDLPSNGIDASSRCAVHCGRYIEGHAVEHFETELHPMALSLADLSVWCYNCEAYVHNERLTTMKNAAHRSKFGEPLPNNG